jgi:hypothetical protein
LHQPSGGLVSGSIGTGSLIAARECWVSACPALVKLTTQVKEQRNVSDPADLIGRTGGGVRSALMTKLAAAVYLYAWEGTSDKRSIWVDTHDLDGTFEPRSLSVPAASSSEEKPINRQEHFPSSVSPRGRLCMSSWSASNLPSSLQDEQPRCHAAS